MYLGCASATTIGYTVNHSQRNQEESKMTQVSKGLPLSNLPRIETSFRQLQLHRASMQQISTCVYMYSKAFYRYVVISICTANLSAVETQMYNA